MLPRMVETQVCHMKDVIKKNRSKLGLSNEDLATKINDWCTKNGAISETTKFDLNNLEMVGTGLPFLSFYSCLMDLKLFTQEDIRAALRTRPIPSSNRNVDSGKGGKKKAVAKKSSPKPGKKPRVSSKG